MIEWDPTFKQLLSAQCRQCPDPYFAPYHRQLLHVGCCSHSPVFGLFEIHKMLKAGDRAFFYEQIYRHEQSVVDDYTVTVHAYVHPLYMEALQEKELSNLEQADLKLSFSVCRFFVEGKGCSLHPAYKTSTCRSFICSTIEEQLTDQQCSELSHRVRQIREEVRAFEVVHQAKLKQKNWTLSSQLEPILDYLEAVK